MARYVVDCEKEGIPAVGLTFADQVAFFRNTALIYGVPEVRRLDVPRTGTGEERVAQFIDQTEAALSDPLTDKEKESGLYTPPPPPRIIFEGTLDDAQEFFQQTTPVATCGNCPIAKYTDGMPIIIPTEDKVAEMLTGTSHSPEEEIKRYNYDTDTGVYTQRDTVQTYARAYAATVEKVAVVAVMAGCKPEYMPVVLAVATTGGGSTSCPGTSGPSGQGFVVSGPIAKEIGMNAKHEAMDVGNPANNTIARSANLITINFGACTTGISRSDSGNPIRTVAFAEDDDGLPPGWDGYNVERGYGPRESVLGKVGVRESGMNQYAPSSFRGLIGEGYGGMARRIGVEGIEGPHNYLEYLLPLYTKTCANTVKSGKLLIMHPNMAISLYDYGFQSKGAVYQWMWDTYFVTAKEVREYGWYDFRTSGGTRNEPFSGIPYDELPDDYLLHEHGKNGPHENCILVCLGGADEVTYVWPAATSENAAPSPYPIDPWR
ncbi:hypothetical protein ACFLTL_00605 [Chloroflexota bacterium]